MIDPKTNQKFQWKRTHLVLAVCALLISLGAAAAALTLFNIPSDPDNHLLAGISLQRWLLVAAMSMIAAFFALVSMKAYRSQLWAGQVWNLLFGTAAATKRIFIGASIGLAVSSLLLITPSSVFGDFQEFFIRLLPLLAFFFLTSALIFILSWSERYELHIPLLRDLLRSQKWTLLISLISLVAAILIWGMMAFTGMGVTEADGFWYGAGVPTLAWQVTLSLLIGMTAFSLRSSISKWSDSLIFILIWVVAAFLWAREPLPSSYFVPGPFPPSFEFHPYSDAATFDLGSQFALIGQGINNGEFFDRALYMAFLVYLHTLAGQDYLQLVALQSAIYAVLPAIMYLLGKSIRGRPFGITLAVLFMLRGVNSIAASTMIDLANQKQLLTDFPAAIFVALIAYLLVAWMKDPGAKYLHLLWMGGLAGLGVMLRTNILFLVGFAGILILIVYWQKKMQGVLLGLLLLISMFAGTFAWGASNNRSVFEVYLYRIQLVIDARYPDLPAPELDLPQGNRISPQQEVASLGPMIGLSANLNQKQNEDASIPYFVSTHFFHNISMAVFALPVSPVFYGLRDTVETVYPFWQPEWNGDISAVTGFFLFINLVLISLGIGAGWRHAKASSLVPLGTFIFYALANSFGRTSGGRYGVPIDWVLLFYFALGLFQVFLWSGNLFGALKESDDDAPQTFSTTVWSWFPLKKAPLIVLTVFLIGTSLPLSEKIYPRKYAPLSEVDLIEKLDRQGALPEMGINKPALLEFAQQNPDFSVVHGRVLYPRFFIENKGLPKNIFPYLTLGFPRISFMLIGPEGVNYVILPAYEIPYFPNSADVIVLGCRSDKDINAFAVSVSGEQITVYTRQPTIPLQCPLPQPVCDENRVCK